MTADGWSPIQLPPTSALPSLQVEDLRGLELLWRHQRERLQKEAALANFLERMRRWWSIETGVIERIYTISEGMTLQLIEYGFDASLIAHGETDLPPDTLIAILNDHRSSLDLVMDVVGKTRDLTPGWIKEVHALLTRHQETTEAIDGLGRLVRVPLLRGAWKIRPNNPLTRDGTIHAYCPPEQVASEMERLIELYSALPPWPELRAAWLHHAFTQIHPFQDGNGRVARALASIDFIRAGLFPMVVRRTERERYISALRAADGGDWHPLVTYFAEVQKSLLIRAFSEAEGALTSRVSFDTVLHAAVQRQQLRQAQDAWQAQARDTLSAIIDAASLLWEQTGADVQARMPGIRTRVLRADGSLFGLYRARVESIARHHTYVVDPRARQDWTLLQLADGGLTDLVLACHLIGNPSPGAAVAVLFVEHRDHDAPPGAAATEAIAEPFLFSIEEDPPRLRHRFLAWLEQARLSALAQWVKYL